MPSYIYVLVQTVGNSGVDPYLYIGSLCLIVYDSRAMTHGL